MSNFLSLSEQIKQMEVELNKLTSFKKLFDKACKIQFGMSTKNIQKMIENSAKNDSTFIGILSPFEAEICEKFNLKTEQDILEYEAIMCSQNNVNYFNMKRAEIYPSDIEQG